MGTDAHQITVGGIEVQVVRKAIKNLHLGVYPPNGRVRVAAPIGVSDDAVRLTVIGRLGWIRRQKARFEGQARQSAREMVSGESHYCLGRRYRLRVIEHNGPGQVLQRNNAILELRVHRGANTASRKRLLHRWYREHLRSVVPALLAKWEAVLGVHAAAWGIKQMKTKWGACNVEARRLWLNLELAKKPVSCLEYLIVHELTHLRERHHNDRFVALMDQHYPTWRRRRDELNAAPLAHETWSY
jgi:predicted metal-dependent hydrolase